MKLAVVTREDDLRFERTHLPCVREFVQGRVRRARR